MSKAKLKIKHGIEFRTEYLEMCQNAKQFENSGDFESAVTALGELWKGVGEKPEMINFPDYPRAELLVLIGSLTGWFGKTRRIEGYQEKAKDMIGEGVELFKKLGAWDRYSESQSDLGVCFWREGDYAAARCYYEDALEKTSPENVTVKAKILLRLVNVAISLRKYSDAVALLNEARPLIEPLDNHILKGKLHSHTALVSKLLFEEENSPDLIEKAFEEYQKASYEYRCADHQRYEANVENNMGSLNLVIGKYDEAHLHLDNAINMLGVFDDSGHVASVYDTKAKVYLAENKLIEAELFSQKSEQLFRESDEFSLYAESLTTLGIVQARLFAFDDAKRSFEAARSKAMHVNDSEMAGLAILAQLENMSDALSDSERNHLFIDVKELFSNSDRPQILRRICAAAEFCLSKEPELNWSNFDLTTEVLSFEAKFITLALNETGGKVTKAAQLLGLSHQNLSLILKKRHKSLAAIKKPRKLRSDRKRAKRKR